MNPRDILKSFFGYNNFRPGQEEIIHSIISGKNVLLILPTGGGKSICYQIPALLSPTFAIVISPLIALMKDQVDSLNKQTESAAFINSTLNYSEIENVLRKLSSNQIKLLYLAPEKLDNIQFVERIKALNPSYLFVDEAHCISEWGHNFRPSYRKIKHFIEFTGIKNISAFTATATEDIRVDIIEQLGIPDAEIIVQGFERSNLLLNVLETKQKKEAITRLLNKDSLPAIIYTATRKSTEEVSDHLRVKGISSAFYHAGLTSEMRRIIQDDFLSGRIEVIVSTNAFGMGIDKSDIRTVIHYNLPGNIENYYQEIGRAGRDGNVSSIYLLFDSKDISIQGYFIKYAIPERIHLETVYNAICDYGKIALGQLPDKEIPIDKNLFTYLEPKGLNKALLESSIKILEESGYIKSISDYYKKHKVLFLLPPRRLNELVNKITDNEIKDLILVLMRSYGSSLFNNHTTMNIQEISRQLSSTEKETISQLNQLSESGIIDYLQPSLFPTVKLAKHRVKSEDLFLNFKKLNELQKNSIKKLQQIIDYVKTDLCRFAYILQYFGQKENNYKCGKCDNCRGVHLLPETTSYIEEHIMHTFKELRGSINKKDLFETLMGKSAKSKFMQLTTFDSCSLHKKTEIEQALSNLILNRKVLSEKNRISLIKDFNMSHNQKNMIEDSYGYEQELKLYNTLRQIRNEVSKKFGQMPYMICPDEIMREIARLQPKAPSDFLNINGFNQRMFNKIGEDFLAAISEVRNNESLSKKLKEKNIPDNILLTLELVQKKYSLEEIARLTKLPESVISMQIESLIGFVPDLEIEQLFDKGELNEIYKSINNGITDLKQLYTIMNNKISYAKLRIALAKWHRLSNDNK